MNETTLSLKFESISYLVNDFFDKYSEKIKKLNIVMSEKSPVKDLYSLGRLLSFTNDLRTQNKTKKIEVEFVFLDNFKEIQLYYLWKLKFFVYCQANHIAYNLHEQFSSFLESLRKNETDSSFDKPFCDTFWCVLPLTTVEISNESETTDFHVQNISKTIKHNILTKTNFQLQQLCLEIDTFLYVFFKEIIDNILKHANEKKFLFALTIWRDSFTNAEYDRYASKIPGFKFRAGHACYEILIMDFGQGIYPRYRKMLVNETSETHSRNDYYRTTKWNDKFKLTYSQETGTIKNILLSELAIRLGTKNGGLSAVGKKLQWFNGVLNLRSGRTEINIQAKYYKAISSEIRDIDNIKPYFLSGVITRFILPSLGLIRQLNKISYDKYRDEVNLIANSNRCEIKKHDYLSRGFFGGISSSNIRKKSEIDARLFVEHYYETQKNTSKERPVFLEINLRLAHEIDIDFIDSFIQELCKLSINNDDVLCKLIFSDVPRNLIYLIANLNCASFLLTSNQYVVFLDEDDTPHIIGLPKISTQVNDVEDCLEFILSNPDRGIQAINLKKTLHVDDNVINCLNILLQENNKTILFREGDIFYAHNIQEVVQENRKIHLDDIKRYSVYKKNNLTNEHEVIYQLNNQHYVNTIIDFCLFWSSSNQRLFDCAKMLYKRIPDDSLDTIVTFYNNGDRLGGVIRKIRNLNNFIIVDPFYKGNWDEAILPHTNYMIVLDAIYPGDEKGFLQKFIEEARHFGANAKYILAFINFTQLQSIANVDIFSINYICPDDVLPKEMTPSAEFNILNDRYLLSKPEMLLGDELCQESSAKSKDYYNYFYKKYTDSEFSLEFWNSISNSEIILLKRYGRETRDVLFHQITERIISNIMMRRHLKAFLCDFMKNVFKLKIDVIIHPTNPVVAYIARLAANQLNITPLIFPLTQRMYGHDIEVTRTDYIYFDRRISEYKHLHKKSHLNTLIIDDSILTGNALCSMLGIAKRLDIHVKGVFVLLNRASSELTDYLKTLSFDFLFLYRLNMPFSDCHPDTSLNQINEKFRENSSSTFGLMWADKLNQEKQHFLSSVESPDTDNRLAIADPILRCEADEKIFRRHELTHIIDSLLLHDDPKIISFETRIAITYNFLEYLVYTQAFWELLLKLFDLSSRVNILYLTKIINILAFSKYVCEYSIYNNFQKICLDCIEGLLVKKKDGLQFSELITESLMALGIIASEKLLSISPLVIQKCSVHALDINNDEKKSAAKNVIGALAWALGVYANQKGNLLFSRIFNSKNMITDNVERNFLVIDIFVPILGKSQSATKTRLDIGETGNWAKQENFTQQLSISPDCEVVKYLSNTIGYECHLSTILKTCNASTVLLYAKSLSDKHYHLRAYKNKVNSKPIENFSVDDLTDKLFCECIRKKITESVFFYSAEEENNKVLNKFTRPDDHQWSIGVPIAPSENGIRYYIILGYNREKSAKFKSAVYYYWLKIEYFLRKILCSMENKYLLSATALNTTIHSLRTIHPKLTTNIRKRIYNTMLGYLDYGNIVKKAVYMFSNKMFTYDTFHEYLCFFHDTILQNLINAADQTRCSNQKEESVISKMLAIKCSIIPNVDYSFNYDSFTLRKETLEFVLHECFCNAFSYAMSEVIVDVDFLQNFEYVIITFNNDIDEPCSKAEHQGEGIKRCETVLKIMDENACIDSYQENKRWKTLITYPISLIPTTIRTYIDGYI